MIFTNNNIVFEVSSEIIEYDISSANVSICREYKLLPTETIDAIANLQKQERVIAIGKLQRKDKEFSKSLEKGFNDAVKRFIQNNGLHESDIIAIKKDAVFVINKNIPNPIVGTHINFVKKNIYHAFIRIKPYEIYFKRDGTIDVKGKDDEKTKYHLNGILGLLKKLVDTCESYGTSKAVINQFMKRAVDDYKELRLPINTYRNFNTDTFVSVDGDMTVDYDFINIDNFESLNIDIGYNYVNFILPLYRTLCQ